MPTVTQPGALETRKCRRTGLLVSLYADFEGDDMLPYSSVCETDNRSVGHTSRTLARDHMADPAGWCWPCRLRVEARALDLPAQTRAAAEVYALAALDCEGDTAVCEWLTRECPECGQYPNAGDGAHLVSEAGHVLVGCEGYYVLPPALVGVDAPLWQDWRGVA